MERIVQPPCGATSGLTEIASSRLDLWSTGVFACETVACHNQVRTHEVRRKTGYSSIKTLT